MEVGPVWCAAAGAYVNAGSVDVNVEGVGDRIDRRLPDLRTRIRSWMTS